jgi:hypothetical protein
MKCGKWNDYANKCVAHAVDIEAGSYCTVNGDCFTDYEQDCPINDERIAKLKEQIKG